MFLPTGEGPATKAPPTDQVNMGVSVRGFSCPSSGVPHLHVVQRLLLPSPSSGAPLVRAVHGLLPSVLCAACASLLRGSSPRACGGTQAVASFPCSSNAYRVLVSPYHGGGAPKRGPRPGCFISPPPLAGLVVGARRRVRTDEEDAGRGEADVLTRGGSYHRGMVRRSSTGNEADSEGGRDG